MILKLTLFALLAGSAYTNLFECQSDTILRFGVEKRVKELQKECNVQAQPDTQLLCESTDDLEKAWKEFVATADEYSRAVTSCRETVERNKQRAGGSPVRGKRAHKHDHDDGHDHHQKEEGHKHRRHAEHDPTDPTINHDGHNHTKRHADHDDPNDSTIDHTNHHHRRRSVDHDPNDPTINHDGHNHTKRHADHDDPNDSTIDHTNHHHRRRSVDHDPNDPTINHDGHNHTKRHADHDDPNDSTIDHTNHHHRRRSVDHDPNDPTINHDGHNHTKRHADHDDPNDSTIDHTNHHHRRRSVDHDPNDPTINHDGHNHTKRHADHDDPNDSTIDHTNHHHRRRSVDHDPNDPTINHDGHNHTKRHADHDPNDPNIDHTDHDHETRRSRRCPKGTRAFRDDGTNPCNPAVHQAPQRTAAEEDRIIQRRSVAFPEQPSFPKSEARLLRARLQQVDDIDEAAADSAHPTAYDGHDYTRREEQEGNSQEKEEIARGEIEEEGRIFPTDPQFTAADIPDISSASSELSANSDRESERVDLIQPSDRFDLAFSSHDDDDLIRRPQPIDQPSSYSVIEDDDVEDQERAVALEDPLIDRTVRDIRRIRRAHEKLSRARRGDCSVAGNKDLHALKDKYADHCERTNICLPDEDLGTNAAEDFKKLHKKHAATYAAYVRELSACYGSLKN